MRDIKLKKERKQFGSYFQTGVGAEWVDSVGGGLVRLQSASSS
jgi:hypothetical protein